MTEMTKIIAEKEGVRTPSKKRSRKDVENALENFKAKKAAKPKVTDHQIISTPALRKRKQAEAEKTAAKPKTTPTVVEPIEMNFISATGYVREAAFDPKTKMFFVAFAKSTWAMPSTAEVWKTFEKAVADPLTNIDSHYRTAFRGRTADMIPVKRQEVNA